MLQTNHPHEVAEALRRAAQTWDPDQFERRVEGVRRATAAPDAVNHLDVTPLNCNPDSTQIFKVSVTGYDPNSRHQIQEDVAKIIAPKPVVVAQDDCDNRYPPRDQYPQRDPRDYDPNPCPPIYRPDPCPEPPVYRTPCPEPPIYRPAPCPEPGYPPPPCPPPVFFPGGCMPRPRAEAEIDIGDFHARFDVNAVVHGIIGLTRSGRDRDRDYDRNQRGSYYDRNQRSGDTVVYNNGGTVNVNEIHQNVNIRQTQVNTRRTDVHQPIVTQSDHGHRGHDRDNRGGRR